MRRRRDAESQDEQVNHKPRDLSKPGNDHDAAGLNLRFTASMVSDWLAGIGGAGKRTGDQVVARRWEGRGVDDDEIRARIEIARRDHRDLDAAIDALRMMPTVDMIQLQRFKKRKLKLRDEIAMLEDLLIPDIIA
jgi:hypothetical protein